MTFRPVILASMLALSGCSDPATSDLDAAKAAAYIVFGLEDGTPLAGSALGENLPVFKQTSASPLTFVAENQTAKMSISVTKTDDCNYGFEVAAKDQTFKFSLDFSGLSTASVTDNTDMGAPPHGTSLKGSKMTCDGPQSQAICQTFKETEVWPLRFNEKDPSRLPAAVQTFKTNICKGKA